MTKNCKVRPYKNCKMTYKNCKVRPYKNCKVTYKNCKVRPCTLYIRCDLTNIYGETLQNQTTVNWAQLSNRYVGTNMLPGSYPHRKYMVCMLGNIIQWRWEDMLPMRDKQRTTNEQLKIELLSR